ncbi:MAG: hypothetical protein JWL58_3953 [Streptosporangiaceae bacterium]|jgi:hypothetical protein|nr:hypothetical protein [Streptosporangiaceae bacterium]
MRDHDEGIGLFAGEAVDPLVQQVGVAVVPGVLLEPSHVNPSVRIR